MLPSNLWYSYFGHLTGKLYKILPLKESGEQTLPLYLSALLAELTGADILLECAERHDFANILMTVAYLSEHIGECDVRTVKRYVFRAISHCKSLQQLFGGGGRDKP